MKFRIMAILTILFILLFVVPVMATESKKFNAPKIANITFVENSDSNSRRGSYFEIDFTVSDDVRDILEDKVVNYRKLPFPVFSNIPYESREFFYNSITDAKIDSYMIQYDYKLDNGDWKYGSYLDEDLEKNNIANYFSSASGASTNQFRLYGDNLEKIFPEKRVPEKSFFDSHKIYFRLRQLVECKITRNIDHTVPYTSISIHSPYGYGKTFILFNISDWTDASYKNEMLTINPVELIDHAPVIKTAELKKTHDGKLYFDCTAKPVHDDIQKLLNITKSELKANMWAKRGGGEWKSIKVKDFSEKFTVDASSFFGPNDDIDMAPYEIKFCYEFDQSDYPPNGKTGIIYSPFSNIISKKVEQVKPDSEQLNKPHWSSASEWAVEELDSAYEMGIIPEALIGQDFTKPITRSEFAAICVKTYEKLGNTKAVPAAVNPFKDTEDAEVLKAYNEGFTSGISKERFEPDTLLNREQAAVMLTRVVKKVSYSSWTHETDADYAIEYTMPEKFSDNANISDWAKPSVYFMVSNGIIAGLGNNVFAPKNTTAAEEEGYANTTREQAILIAYRLVTKKVL